MTHSLHDSILLCVSVLPNGDASLAFEDLDGISGRSGFLLLHGVTCVERHGGLPGSVWRVVAVGQDGLERANLKFGAPESCSMIQIDMQQMPYSETPPAKYVIKCSEYFLYCRVE
jgi:hypothetical protein